MEKIFYAFVEAVQETSMLGMLFFFSSKWYCFAVRELGACSTSKKHMMEVRLNEACSTSMSEYGLETQPQLFC